VIPSDLISDTRISDFSIRAKVSRVSDYGVLIAQFTIDKPMVIGIVAAGPSLGAFGVSSCLADPALDIVNSSGITINTISDISQATLSSIKIYHSWINSTKEPGITGLSLSAGTYSVVVRNQNEIGSPTGGIAFLSIWEM
jgi:hypothetical protein